MSKKHEATDQNKSLVTQMCAAGISHEQIAAVMQISADTLTKYYDQELSTAKSKVIAKVAGTLVNKALKGDNTCMIFYLKTQGGWRETQHHEVTGKDGKDIIPVINIKLK